MQYSSLHKIETGGVGIIKVRIDHTSRPTAAAMDAWDSQLKRVILELREQMHAAEESPLWLAERLLTTNTDIASVRVLPQFARGPGVEVKRDNR